ncbi:MAG TPA: SRPBCC domain-containing protein [Candidatus Limnocylindrales bacterium]|jgi:uncharacterized protein YndB with AHSA1/START domain|nr:SRPBCC domain-containing protein [Candidatus Limnocylindrales bacterium]
MIEPLRLSFDVDAPQDHAFDTWTRAIGRWWPADHTHTGRSDLQIVLEGRVGGRIFERTPDGHEWDWGEVTAWEPPVRLAYLWHLKRDRAEATEVEIRFSSLADDATRVDIEHRGWEVLGAESQTWRDRNMGGWATLLPHYREAVATANGKEESA